MIHGKSSANQKKKRKKKKRLSKRPSSNILLSNAVQLVTKNSRLFTEGLLKEYNSHHFTYLLSFIFFYI